MHILEEGFDLFSVPSSSASTEKKHEDEQGSNADDALGDAVLHIVSHVHESNLDEYKKWVERLKSSMGCLSRPGMKQVISNFGKDPVFMYGLLLLLILTI
jgi:hypothetical protein